MNPLSKRLLAVIGLLLAASILVAACGANGGTAPTASQGDEAESSEAASEEVAADAESDEAMVEGDLSLMGWASSESENERLQTVVDAFNEEHPDMQVALNLVPSYDEKLQASLSGGAPPDAFYIDSFKLPDFAAAGALAPIGDELSNPDDFYPALRNAFTYEGTFYCPPKDFSTLGLFYNKDMFEQAGIEEPTADWTWDDLQAAAEAITAAGIEVDGNTAVGLSLSADFARLIAFIYQAGGSVTDEDFTTMTINSPEALEAVNFYVNLVLDGYAAPPSELDSGWNGEAFGKQRAAMTVEGNWMVPFLADQFPDVNYGIAELPAGPGGKATMAFTVCYGAPADGANPEGSLELIDFLTGEEGMKQWTDLGLAMPTRQSLRDGWLEQFPDLEPLLNGADHAHPWQFRPGFSDVLDTINAGLQEAFLGTKLPEDVLAEAEEVGNEVLSRE